MTKRVTRHWIRPESNTPGARLGVTSCGRITDTHTHCAVEASEVTCQNCLRVPEVYGGPPKGDG